MPVTSPRSHLYFWLTSCKFGSSPNPLLRCDNLLEWSELRKILCLLIYYRGCKPGPAKWKICIGQGTGGESLELLYCLHPHRPPSTLMYSPTQKPFKSQCSRVFIIQSPVSLPSQEVGEWGWKFPPSNHMVFCLSGDQPPSWSYLGAPT